MNEASLAQRSLRNFSLVLLVASVLTCWRWSMTGEYWFLVEIWFYPALASLLCVIALFVWPQIKLAWSSVLFWIMFLICIYANAVTTIFFSKSLIEFAPFGGFKVAAVMLAILAPQPILNGYLAISLCGLIPTILYYTLLEDYQFRFSIQEPGLTIVTVVVSLMVLIYRNRNIQTDRSYARLAAEKENLQELAHILLALRDLTNTPLQIVSLTACLLERRDIDSEKASQYLKSAVDKLTRVSQVLTQDERLERMALEPASFYDSSDPVDSLQKRLKAIQDKAQ
jgi:hypothetical protein